MSDETQSFDIADYLAALNRIRLIEELEPEFYAKHWQRVAYITSGVSVFSQFTDDLRLGMSLAANAPHDEAAPMIRTLWSQVEMAPDRATWFDKQFEHVMRSALLLTREPDLPEWLHYARTVIESAFDFPTQNTPGQPVLSKLAR